MKLEDRTGDAYEKLQAELAELAPQYCDLWHELLPFGDLFIITMCTGRRGRQGLYEMKKDMFKIVEDDEYESGRKAFKQDYGELTKNQQMTNEDIRKGGSIPFEEMAETKLNPGEYHEEYLKTLHPEVGKMFQKAKELSPTFNLKSGEKVLFSLNGGKGMGESRVGQYMSMVRFAFTNNILLIKIKFDNKAKVWVATVFCVARTHLACPDLGSHAHVRALQFFGGRTTHPHLFKAKITLQS